MQINNLCPYCKSEISPLGGKCKHCGEWFDEYVSGTEHSGFYKPDTLIMQALGKQYKIVREIGSGGIATVFEVVNKKLGRTEALKVLHQNLVHNKEFTEHFLREARILAQLNHSNIVKVFNLGSVGSVHYMAMEYLEGEDLFEKIQKEGPFSADALVKWIIPPIARALHYIHQWQNKGIIHRDVKSSNIIITPQGKPVLVDFGIAFTEVGLGLTSHGDFLGAPEYMSPEAHKGEKLEGTSDLWSLGVVMYECLTGRLPISAKDPLALKDKVANEDPVPVRQLNEKIPQRLEDIITKLLEKDSGKRFQSGEELAIALESAGLDDKDPIPPFRERKSGKLLPWIIAGVILLISLVIFNIIDNGKGETTHEEIVIAEREKQGKIQQFIEDGDSYFQNKNYEQAVKNYNNALSLVPENQIIKNKIFEAEKLKLQADNLYRKQQQEKINNFLDEGDYYYTKKQFQYALNSYNSALKIVPDDATIKNKIILTETAKKEEEKRLEDIRRKEEQRIQSVLRKYGMIEINGGSFNMGSNSSDAQPDEKPRHNIQIGNFYLSRYELTQALWEEIMENNPSHFRGANLPVENVSWNDVQTFLSRLNAKTGLKFRLPTEAEWEYAASGRGLSYKYSGSNNIENVGWCWTNSNSTNEVATKVQNSLGIFDMTGNVWEWCSDWYDKDYYNKSPTINPVGPASGNQKVVRGGGFETMVSIRKRHSFMPNQKFNFLGFRLAI